jgi:hypothetical protein
MKAHSVTIKVTFDVAVDMFALGFIVGKRSEKKGVKNRESK